jgi:diguanylate cyclase (GGDEF)-like protein
VLAAATLSSIQTDRTEQKMKNNIRLLISAGLLALPVLIFMLVSVSLVQLHSSTQSMARLVEVTNLKTAAANDMRDAIRLLNNSLDIMRLTDNPGERDEEYQEFMRHEGKYWAARERLISLGMDATEHDIHQELTRLTREAQPYNDDLSESLQGIAPADELASTLAMAGQHRNDILEQLDRLVALEQENSRALLSTNQKHYRGTRKLLFTLVGIALVFCIMVGRIVIQRVSAKNRKQHYEASRDTLTGLINRRGFEKRVKRAIQQARTQSVTHTLLYLDLDQFRLVNETYGHQAGDQLLQQLGQLLLSSVRQRDTLSRLGADEFGMLLENCPLERAIQIANNLLSAVDGFQFTWGDSSFTPGINIGMVTINRNTANLEKIMNAADSACYLAKQSDKSQLQIAHLGDPDLQEQHSQLHWASRLSTALKQDCFTLYFQPINVCDGKPRHDKHIEILLRMIDDDGLTITPAVFLPAIEKHQLGADIDRWVIRNALAWLAQENTCNHWPIRITINLSNQSLTDPTMLKYIIDQKNENGINPQQVCFEITELAAITNIATATSFMLTLRGCGFRFSLDDFGSNLSSFVYLKKLPVDYIKIDGTYTRDIMTDPIDRALVKSINKMGHLLGKETIAEGVETMDVADELKRIGIDYIAGYAYTQPRPLEDFSRVMGPRLMVVSS